MPMRTYFLYHFKNGKKKGLFVIHQKMFFSFMFLPNLSFLILIISSFPLFPESTLTHQRFSFSQIGLNSIL